MWLYRRVGLTETSLRHTQQNIELGPRVCPKSGPCISNIPLMTIESCYMKYLISKYMYSPLFLELEGRNNPLSEQYALSNRVVISISKTELNACLEVCLHQGKCMVFTILSISLF